MTLPQKMNLFARIVGGSVICRNRFIVLRLRWKSKSEMGIVAKTSLHVLSYTQKKEQVE